MELDQTQTSTRARVLEEAEVHLVVEANKAADYLELVVPPHRKLRHLELQRNRARCLGINRNKINPRPLVNLRKVLASARLNNNNLDHSSAPSRLLHLLVVLLELHLNKRHLNKPPLTSYP